MTAIASIHFADIGVAAALRLQIRPPSPGRVAGLRHADVGLAAPLGPSVLPSPSLRRVGLLTYWDDERALDAFVADHPVAAALRGGWRARLEPTRIHGAWPGLDADIPKPRKTPHDGPAVVLTLGKLRWSQSIRFLRASAKAEAAVLAAPGVLWATGLAKPPFVCTVSVWESSAALQDYAYGDTSGGHPGALAASRDRPFHHRQAFVRFHPTLIEGRLDGKNPLPEAIAASHN